jgi:hypothetical protein
MFDWMNGKRVQWKKSKPRRNSLIAMLVAWSVAASAPTPVRADDRVPLEGTFTVVYVYPSASNYCGDGAGKDYFSIQAQGLGSVPDLGAMFLTVKKCLAPDGTYTGTFMMRAGNGHVLRGNYEGTQGPYNKDSFSTFWGVLTITGGTGKFWNASGRLTFEAVSGPDSLGAVVPTLNGTAFYRVRAAGSSGSR